AFFGILLIKSHPGLKGVICKRNGCRQRIRGLRIRQRKREPAFPVKCELLYENLHIEYFKIIFCRFSDLHLHFFKTCHNTSCKNVERQESSVKKTTDALRHRENKKRQLHKNK